MKTTLTTRKKNPLKNSKKEGRVQKVRRVLGGREINTPLGRRIQPKAVRGRTKGFGDSKSLRPRGMLSEA